MCIWRICTVLGSAKVRSQTPPWSLQVRCPCPWDPPEPLQSSLWSPQGAPRTPPRAPKDSQGPLKSARLTITKPRKYVYLALKDHKNSFFSIFGPLLGPLGDALVRDLTIQTPPWRPKALQGPPRDLRGRALGPLGRPRAFFQNLHKKRSQPEPPNAPLLEQQLFHNPKS